MKEKIALVTGTSAGLGISIVIQLANKDFKVYATMRNLDKQEALIDAAQKAGVTIHILPLDVQSTDSVESCVNTIIEKEGQIDVLVNNAGAGFIRTTEHATDEDVDWILDVNLKGVIRCTRAVLPHMRSKKSGHIVNVTSVGGLVGQPFNEMYCASKFAIEGYTESLASYITPAFNIQFSCVEPGGIKSEFANSIFKQFQETGGMRDDEYKPLLEKYIGGSGDRRGDGVYQTSDEVAEVVVGCILNKEPPLRTRTSDWSNEFCNLKTQADPTGVNLAKQVSKSMLDL